MLAPYISRLDQASSAQLMPIIGCYRLSRESDPSHVGKAVPLFSPTVTTSVSTDAVSKPPDALAAITTKRACTAQQGGARQLSIAPAAHAAQCS